MPVTEQHPEYIKAMPRYKLIRSIVNNDAKCYIRTPDADDKERSCQYKDDAILTNFTKLTCEGLTGLVFRKAIDYELPLEMEYLIEEATGAGVNLSQASQSITYDTIQTGRFGVLIDFHNDGKRAYLKPYASESIINWKAAEIGGIVQPWLIVLQETIIIDNEDLFSQETKTQFRVLLLLGGIYYQQIRDEDDNILSSFAVTDFNGDFFNYIPFVFIGSKDNDWNVDNQPLYDLAILNLGHYRNSADQEESGFICGQPYPVICVGESSSEEFLQANLGGVKYGARKGLVLANGGSAQLLQANPNQLIGQMMKDKLQEAAKIGARLIEEAGGRETAEAAKIRYGSQHSALYTLTSNISWGIEKAIKIACRFMGANPDLVVFKLNKDFYDESQDANMIAQMWIGLDKGAVSKEEVRETLTAMGVPLSPETDVSALKAPPTPAVPAQ